MVTGRLILEQGGCYHCISRVVDRQFIFGATEKEVFRVMMRRLEEFLGVRVLTYCLMSNHFHLLVEVPDPGTVEPLNENSLRRRLPLLYRGKDLLEVFDELDRAVAHAQSSSGSRARLDELLARYQARMGNLSVFLKELKARFTFWYNGHNDRCGTLWESRFRSVVVEGDELALMTMAAYIELNPVRAGLVSDPKDYRWCGYAEAVAGKKRARLNLVAMHRLTRAWQGRSLSWGEVGAAYRVHLFGKGERRPGDGRTGRGARPGLDPDVVEEEVEKREGRLPMHTVMLDRVRYFCDGAVFGSAEFVESTFEKYRQHFGENRKSGARPMRGADWKGLATMRDLRNAVPGRSDSVS